MSFAAIVYLVSVAYSVGITILIQKIISSNEIYGKPNSSKPKNPLVAGLLSFLLFGGGGYIYLGQVIKGVLAIALDLLIYPIAFLLAFIISLIVLAASGLIGSDHPVANFFMVLTVILPAACINYPFAVNAYRAAKEHNAGKVAAKPNKVLASIGQFLSIIFIVLFSILLYLQAISIFTWLTYQPG